MTWWQFIAPVVAIALLVRLEAVVLAPDYWAWLELFPQRREEDPYVRRQRLYSMIRRVAIPGIVTFVFVSGGLDQYSQLDLAIVGVGGAALLLWPIVSGGLPDHLGLADWELATYYAALVGAFAASAATGGLLSRWAVAQHGSIAAFLQAEFVSIAIGVLISVFFGGVADRASARLSMKRHARQELELEVASHEEPPEPGEQ